MVGLTVLGQSPGGPAWQAEHILSRATSQGDCAVLEYVLDHIVDAADASLAALLLDEPGSSRLSVARERGGVTLLDVEGMLDPDVVEDVLVQGVHRFVTCSGASGRWIVGLPLVVDEKKSALLIQGTTRSPFGVSGPGESLVRSLTSAVGLAHRIDELKRENRQLREQLYATPDAAKSSTRSGGTTSRRPTTERPRDASGDLFPEIVGTSSILCEALRNVADFASCDIPVLIEGESGTGKELVARGIHRIGSRSEAPFVSENCGAIPENLVETEVFGHEKGAFTGAQQCRPGLLERAHGGTLFLDEIGEMTLDLQKRFLRVLQERSVRRVGGRKSISVDIRLISATNRDLEAMVSEGTFREDLFYRLHVGCVRLPPLRHRSEDVPLLITHFVRLYCAQLGRPSLEFSTEAIACLRAYPWPGNVRELGNEIQRLATTVRHVVQPPDLRAKLSSRRQSAAAAPLKSKSLAELEREVLGGAILDVLKKTRGNLSRSAKVLGVTRTTLYRRLERYGIRYR
jgi:transcriptional regulator with PAS, ATPase and Fis domain